MSRIKEAQYFLNYLKKIKIENPHIVFDRHCVYQFLARYGLKEKDYDKSGDPIWVREKYFQRWIKAFEGKKQIKVFSTLDWRYWCQFTNGNIEEFEFLKMYLSLDSEHLYEGVLRLFSYMEKENIVHLSKVASEVRSDGIVVRLRKDDMKSLKKICNFIEQDPYIQEGKNCVNPFLLTIGSVGVMLDDGGSYNSEIASVIAEYINSINLNEEIEFSNFLAYAKELLLKWGCYNSLNGLSVIYDNVSTVEDEDNKDKNTLKIPQMINDIIRLAIITNFEKYNKEQVITAVNAALSGEYGYFSRYSEADEKKEYNIRENLKSKVTPDIFEEYIKEKSNYQINNKNDMIVNFVDNIIYESKGIIFEKAMLETAKKYNDTIENLHLRIRIYINDNNHKAITKYGIGDQSGYNYREAVVKNVSPKQAIEVIEATLGFYGIEYWKMGKEEKIISYSNLILNQLGVRKSKR